MGFWSNAKSSGSKLLNAGKNKDILEGACSVAALAAGSSGDVSNEESRAAIEIILENRVIQAGGWSEGEVATQFESYVPKAKRYSGQAELRKEMKEASARDKTGEVKEFLFLLAADIVAADGEVDEKEAKFLGQLAVELGVDKAKYGL